MKSVLDDNRTKQQGINYPWILVALLWGVALMNYMDRQMFATMRPSMQINIHDLEQAANFGRLMAVFLWIYGLMSPISGMIADKMNRKWIIICSLLVGSIVDFSLGFAINYNQVYVLRSIMGISEALYIPSGLSLIADYHDSKTKSFAIGVHMTGIYMGQALGGFGATFAKLYSWQTAFHVFGLIGMGYAVVLFFFLKEKRNQKTSDLKALDSSGKPNSIFKVFPLLFSNFSFLILLLYFAIPSLPGWAIKNWLPTLFSTNLKIEMSQAAPIATITIALSSLIGVLVGGKFSDKWVQKNFKARIYIGFIGLSLMVPSLVLLGYGHSVFSFISAAFCFGIGFGLFDANNMPILCQFVSQKYRATAYGLMNMTGVFAGAFITNLLGKSTDAGNLGNGFAMLSIIVVAVALLAVSFLKPKMIDYSE